MAEKERRFTPGPNGGFSYDAKEAIRALSKQDARMAKLIAQVGPFRLQIEDISSPFEALAESIVYQQLTGKAAATIFSRVLAIYGGKLPAPSKIVKTPDEILRGAGLSTAKTAAIKDLAAKQHEGVLPDLDELATLADDEIIERLITVRGVGRWTVEMLLIFRLGRPDVLPIHDYGVQKGFMLTYRKKELPKPKELDAFGERWRPYRSVAAWYLWRANELTPEQLRLVR